MQNRSSEDAGHDDRAQVAPGDLPIESRPVARHVVNVFSEPATKMSIYFHILIFDCESLPFVPINIHNGDHLKKGDQHEANRSRKRVEQREPVFASTRAEDETDEKANCTHST
jgi:hypothetical protein